MINTSAPDPATAFLHSFEVHSFPLQTLKHKNTFSSASPHRLHSYLHFQKIPSLSTPSLAVSNKKTFSSIHKVYPMRSSSWSSGAPSDHSTHGLSTKFEFFNLSPGLILAQKLNDMSIADDASPNPSVFVTADSSSHSHSSITTSSSSSIYHSQYAADLHVSSEEQDLYEGHKIPDRTDIFHELNMWIHSGKGPAFRAAFLSTVVSFIISLGISNYQGSIPRELLTPANIAESQRQLHALIAMPQVVVAVSVGISAMVQSVIGFGFNMVCYGFLSQIAWIVHSSTYQDIILCASIFSAIQQLLIVSTSSQKFLEPENIKELFPLIFMSLLFQIPGHCLVKIAPQLLILKLLGALVVGYCVYSFAGVSLPKFMGSKRAGWGFGALAGLVCGAVNMPAPIFIVYGNAAGWDKEKFRLNMFAVIGINNYVFLAQEYVAGMFANYYVGSFFIWSLPLFIVGTLTGLFVKSRINAETFRIMVLSLCLFLGTKMLLR